MYCTLYQGLDSHQHIKLEQLRSAIKCHSMSARVAFAQASHCRSRTWQQCSRRSLSWSYDPKSQSRAWAEDVQLPWLHRASPHHTRSLAPLLKKNCLHTRDDVLCCRAEQPPKCHMSLPMVQRLMHEYGSRCRTCQLLSLCHIPLCMEKKKVCVLAAAPVTPTGWLQSPTRGELHKPLTRLALTFYFLVWSRSWWFYMTWRFTCLSFSR